MKSLEGSVNLKLTSIIVCTALIFTYIGLSTYLSISLASALGIIIFSNKKVHFHTYITIGYLYYWFTLILINQDLLTRAYEHSLLTLILLIALVPILSSLFAYIGLVIGKRLRRLISSP